MVGFQEPIYSVARFFTKKMFQQKKCKYHMLHFSFFVET
jgi:hypothetical protein